MIGDTLTEPSFERLQWDSEFFGLQVARTRLPASQESIRRCLCKARGEKVDLLYWAVTNGETLGHQLRSRIEPYKIVQQLKYCKRIRGIIEPPKLPNEYTLKSVAIGPAPEPLVKLGMLAGHESRFKLDQRFGDDAFARMYRVWLDRSCLREMATDVLTIVAPTDEIAAFVTVNVGADVADIGLIAVSENHQRKGLGLACLRAVDPIVRRAGAGSLCVVTQATNTPAMSLYQRHGMALVNQTTWYHFWLDQIPLSFLDA